MYSVEFHIVVNGLSIATDLQYVDTNGQIISVAVSTIYGLNAGDIVNIQFYSTIQGFITVLGSPGPPQSTSFSAARWPFISPIPLTAIQDVNDEHAILPFGEFNSNIE
ncbi:hypothetical protein [Bacillus wiedmannii]|uniref:hypothetical protein n=1 Tax=Bacillus wiedmannii TaxID=1890302 RepID=UPI0020D21CFD|nr:hypothetical protein [Bacillus wiedmannii]